MYMDPRKLRAVTKFISWADESGLIREAPGLFEKIHGEIKYMTANRIEKAIRGLDELWRRDPDSLEKWYLHVLRSDDPVDAAKVILIIGAHVSSEEVPLGVLRNPVGILSELEGKERDLSRDSIREILKNKGNYI